MSIGDSHLKEERKKKPARKPENFETVFEEACERIREGKDD